MHITTHCIMAGRYNGQPDPDIHNMFGRNWFYFLPHIYCNGGKFWAHEVTDISLIWLFWVFNFTIYGNN